MTRFLGGAFMALAAALAMFVTGSIALSTKLFPSPGGDPSRRTATERSPGHRSAGRRLWVIVGNVFMALAAALAMFVTGSIALSAKLFPSSGGSRPRSVPHPKIAGRDQARDKAQPPKKL